MTKKAREKHTTKMRAATVRPTARSEKHRGPERLLLLSLLLFMLAPAALAEEPRVRVETYPHWTVGDLAIYLMEFPGDGATYSSDTIRIRVAVWGVTRENPVKILLNGE
ncbi:MAG: hypothetical protein V1924_00845, partial [Candidatus Bathyarchaeota archaeon]